MSPVAAAAAILVAALPAYRSTDLSFLDTWLSLWPLLFIVGFALIALEGAFFMQSPEIHRVSQFAAALVATAMMAAIVASIVHREPPTVTLLEQCRRFLAERSGRDWLVRLVGVALSYTVLYVAIGSAAWPVVREYYQDPKNGLALRVPRGPIIISLQMTRGLVTTMTLVPLIAAAPPSDSTWWLRLSLLLAGVMGIGPLIMATRWPARLRWLHAVEISAFSVPYSFTACFLIARPGMSPNA